MTAEIIIMNREAVVLASDSAVSSEVGVGTKTSTSANKLFSLSYQHPIGLMIYGNASFMGLPWETLIKYYRTNVLPECGFNTLEEYANSFIQYLDSENINFTRDAEDEYIVSFVYGLFSLIKREIDRRIEGAIIRGEELTEDRVQNICRDVINKHFQRYSKEPKVLRINDIRAVIRKHNRQVENIKKKIFQRLELPRELQKRLGSTLVYALARHFLENVGSGVVVAGFGHNEFVPEARSFQIEGIIWLQDEGELKKILKYKTERVASVGVIGEYIGAFAQKDMVQRFMNGVDLNYAIAQAGFLEGLCGDFVNKVVGELNRYNDEEKEVIKGRLNEYSTKIMREFSNNMKQFVEQWFNEPILEAVARLPKNDLAKMAEALVSLTSLKRRISQEPETVAEPIDVAVITKGDGFIWIKRKHYFQANLNLNYLTKCLHEFRNIKNGDEDAE